MPPRARAALEFVAWGTLFGLAFGQSPLYTSNQNQYFLHGLAQAGIGSLSEDWLANTADPTPLFTSLVTLTQRVLHPAFYYLYFLMLAGLYFLSLRRIAVRIFDFHQYPNAQWAFAALLFIAHSAALRFALGRGIGGEWEYLFDGGVAGQRLLGDVLQPSAFGVLLLVSIQQYLEGHHMRAIAASALAVAVHPTYLLSAGVLTVAYVFETSRGEGARRSAQLAGLGFALTLPILIYLSRTFLPTSAEAQRILVDFRIPAHAIPAVWFDAAVIVKLVGVGLALYLTRGSKLAVVMGVSAAIGIGLTALQVTLASDALALAFPWRISTYLVPLATAILVGAACGWIAKRVRVDLLRPLCALVVGLAVLSGAASSAVQATARQAAPERGAQTFVDASRMPGQVYLIPPKLQDFRLATGAPIVADFKSIPYRGDEVLEWYARVRLLGFFYRDQVAEIDCGLLAEFAIEYGVTHVVLEPDQRGLACAGLTQLYDDGQYAVFELELQR